MLNLYPFRSLTPRLSAKQPHSHSFFNTALLSGLLLCGGSASLRASVVIPSQPVPSLYLLRETLTPVPLQDDPNALDFLKPGDQVALVQFTGPVQDAWKTAAESCGLHLLQTIPDFGFAARGEKSAFLKAAQLPFVRWMGPYKPDYRISPALPATGSVTALVEAEQDSALSPLIQAARTLGFNATPAGDRLLRVSGDATALRQLAERDDVRWIGAPVLARPMNDHTRVLMGVNALWADLGLYGDGQIVGIVDTGLDSGDETTLSPDFKGRLEKGISLVPGLSWDDTHGHGTHVAGAIVGQGRGTGPLPDPQSFAGVAPHGKLVVQAVDLDRDGYENGLPDDLGDLYTQAYDAGARIHNDSWGDDFSPYGSYSLHSSQVDDFIWKHPDFSVVFAAGNDGSDSPTPADSPLDSRQIQRDPGDGIVRPGSLYAPGTAKNAITVGATEGDRPPTGNWGGYTTSTWKLWGFPAPPISTDYTSDHPEGMLPMSSRGPTQDGRIKPDLAAPGSNIISTLSQHGAGSNMWGNYKVAGYAYNGGTSIATGFVSGAVALVRQWYQQNGVSQPSAALLKATLLNGGRELAPGQYGTDKYQEIPARPNGVEGWGRVDVGMAVHPPAPLTVRSADPKGGLSTGQSQTWLLRVNSAGNPLRVMLAWSDYPAAPDVLKSLVNDLDLTVTTPDKQTLSGNGQADRKNNVESITLASAGSGTYRITVNGYNVPQGPQPYAVTALGAGEPLILLGDVTGDGKTTVGDVVKTLQSVVGLQTLTETEALAADVFQGGTSAGRVDILDVTALLRLAIGL